MSIIRERMNKLLYICIIKFCVALNKITIDLNVLIWKAVQHMSLSEKSILQKLQEFFLNTYVFVRVSKQRKKI